MTDITISATDGAGSFKAYLAKPTTQTPAAKAPGLILIQEIFGVNAVMRDWCETFAQQGYLTVCPDLFWRQQPGIQLTDQTQGEWQQAVKLYQAFNLEKGMADLKATLAAVRQLPECNGEVGCIGFCLGGRLAVLMATRTDCDASVSYYGVSLEQHLAEYGAIKKPLLMHVAENDRYATPDLRAQYEPMLKTNPAVEYHLYRGVDHAFARPNGENYNAAAARLANERTADFLRRHLQR